MKKLRIIVGGYLGLLPAGGVTWDYVQYPVGFAELGHDVYYIEDTRLYPMYQKAGSNWDDSSSCVEHLAKTAENFGFANRWAYRDEASGKCFGLPEKEVLEIARTADVFVNISCSTVMREEYATIPARILIDSDPMFTQIQMLSEQKFTPGKANLNEAIAAHNFLFTFGENIGSADCRLPTCDLDWKATRQPICLKYWKPSLPDKNAPLTTVMNWTAAKNLEYEGETWGQKDVEFLKFIDLPTKVLQPAFAVGVGQTGGTEANSFPFETAQKAGWQIMNPELCAENWLDYKSFIEKSFGEFSVAKETYIKAKTGWFSCRSACYLASGRPVVTQETGWSKFIPTGEGLFAFSNETEAIEAIREVRENITKHSLCARQIAEDYFDSKKVLSRMLEAIL
jgi:hypothetical protein